MRNLVQNLLALVLGLAVAATAAELCLRIYNPFPFRVKNADIVLPLNARYHVTTHADSKLDPEVVHTKNSLGFRGPEPLAENTAALRIVTIGGSTTECFYISDGKTWPDLLLARCRAGIGPGFWLNNAGLDGHSTRGHALLLRKFLGRLKPDVALFLVGINDLDIETRAGYDLAIDRSADLGSRASLAARLRQLALRSELVDTLVNLRRAWFAKRAGLHHAILDFRSLPSAADPGRAELPEADRLNAYAERLRELLALSRAQGMTPVLLTQPALYGDGLDPDTGLDLATVQTGGGLTGHMAWARLEAYNDVTRRVARAEGAELVDLAAALPKRSAFFYDFIHFSNAGNEAVADIVFMALRDFLAHAAAGRKGADRL